jgi:hypothetical protein
LLAVEGRRLNGYNVCVPSIVNDSPYRDDIRWALKRAHVAKSTEAIVKIAIELFNRLREHGKDEGQGDGQQDGQQQDGQGDKQDGQQDGQPDGKQDGGEGQPSNEQGGQPSDGQDGEPSDGQGKQSADGNQDGEQSGEQSEDGKNGSGKADESFNGGRDVEPSGFIEDSLGSYSNTVDLVRPRPCVGKPQYETFEWR